MDPKDIYADLKKSILKVLGGIAPLLFRIVANMWGP